MILQCSEDFRVSHQGRTYLFESHTDFGYVYEVDQDLGVAVVKTGKAAELKDYKGPTELPSSTAGA